MAAATDAKDAKAWDALHAELATDRAGTFILSSMCREYIASDGTPTADKNTQEAITAAIKDRLAGLTRKKLDPPHGAGKPIYVLVDQDAEDPLNPSEAQILKYKNTDEYIDVESLDFTTSAASLMASDPDMIPNLIMQARPELVQDFVMREILTTNPGLTLRDAWKHAGQQIKDKQISTAQLKYLTTQAIAAAPPAAIEGCVQGIISEYGIPRDKNDDIVKCHRELPGQRITCAIKGGKYAELIEAYSLDATDFNDVIAGPYFAKIHGRSFQDPNSAGADRVDIPGHVRAGKIVWYSWTNGTYGPEYAHFPDLPDGRPDPRNKTLRPHAWLKDSEWRRNYGDAGVYFKTSRQDKVLELMDGSDGVYVTRSSQIKALQDWENNNRWKGKDDSGNKRTAPRSYSGGYQSSQDWDKSMEEADGICFAQGGKCMVINTTLKHPKLDAWLNFDRRLAKFKYWRDGKIKDPLAAWLEKYDDAPEKEMAILKSKILMGIRRKLIGGNEGQPGFVRQSLNLVFGGLFRMHKEQNMGEDVHH